MKLMDRLMMRWLRYRGWTVFWLDPDITCNGVCWLEQYRRDS